MLRIGILLLKSLDSIDIYSRIPLGSTVFSGNQPCFHVGGRGWVGRGGGGGEGERHKEDLSVFLFCTITTTTTKIILMESNSMVSNTQNMCS